PSASVAPSALCQLFSCSRHCPPPDLHSFPTRRSSDLQIVDFRKTMVRSPERADTLQSDFLHQERFLLQPGAYALTVELHDANLADRKSTRLNSSHVKISYAVFCLKKKMAKTTRPHAHN